MVLALAGRRIDAVGQAQARFPLAQVPAVQHRLRTLLVEQDVRILVCSAACGADLVALGEAAKIGIERHVILPFNPERFRTSSVIDRPGSWGEDFDRVLVETRGTGGVVVLPESQDAKTSYLAANHLILEKTRELAFQTGDRAAAALVWDRRSRGTGDLTAEFGDEAQRMSFPLFEIDTSDGFNSGAITQLH